MTGAAFSTVAPEERCWSEQGRALHAQIFDIFGGKRQPRR